MNQLIDYIKENNSFFLNGEWGVGKTTFINDWLKKNQTMDIEFIYFDARLIELCDNYWSILSDIFYEDVDKQQKKLNKINVGIWVANGFIKKFNTIPHKQTSGKKIVTSKLKSERKICIIFDELDRILPKTMIKVLNTINVISALSDDNRSISIITIGDIQHINKIIRRELDISKNECDNYLKKYFLFILNFNNIFNHPQSLLNIFNENKFDWLIKILKEIDLYKFKTVNGIGFDMHINLRELKTNIQNYYLQGCLKKEIELDIFFKLYAKHFEPQQMYQLMNTFKWGEKISKFQQPFKKEWASINVTLDRKNILFILNIDVVGQHMRFLNNLSESEFNFAIHINKYNIIKKTLFDGVIKNQNVEKYNMIKNIRQLDKNSNSSLRTHSKEWFKENEEWINENKKWLDENGEWLRENEELFYA